jgi:hypothetical protein
MSRKSYEFSAYVTVQADSEADAREAIEQLQSFGDNEAGVSLALEDGEPVVEVLEGV